MEKIGIILTVKAPVEQVMQFIHYHLNIGVDHILIFFDDPNDPAISTAARYSKVGSVRCSSQYWQQVCGSKPDFIEERQKHNLHQGISWFSMNDFTWMICVDIDELIHPRQQSLKQLLAASDADAIRFPIREAFPTQAYYQSLYQPEWFKVDVPQSSVELARELGCDNAIFQGEYFRGHTVSKMAVRLGPHLEFHKNLHGLSEKGRKVVNADSLALLHYDCIDFENWRQKWEGRLDGSATAACMRTNRKNQFLLYQDARRRGENALRFLFYKLHVLTPQEQEILSNLRMLERIQLNPELFAAPS